MSKLQSIRNSQGFTLIELLIVVVIIGILAAIAIPQFASTKEKAFDSSAKSDIRNMQTAQEGYFADNQEYAAVSIAAATQGGTGDLGDGTIFKASPQVAVTVGTATNGYTITAKHSGSESSWCVDTTAPATSSIHDCTP